MTEHDRWCESTARGVEERLRVRRLQAGLTQAQLADGTTRSAIAWLERGLHRTSLDAINRVVVALGCEAAMLNEQERTA
jgi:transcriptional regulator with XRE-family HTH domain